MNALLSLPHLSSTTHHRKQRFDGSLPASVAEASRRWLRHGLRVGTVAPTQAATALKGGPLTAAELAASVARATLPAPGLSRMAYAAPPDRDAVAATLRWLLRTRLVTPSEVPAMLADPARLSTLMGDVEASVEAEVATLCHPGVPRISPCWSLSLMVRQPGDDAETLTLAFLVSLERAPFFVVPPTSPAFVYLDARLRAFNQSSAFLHIEPPLGGSNCTAGWHYEEAIDDLRERLGAGESLDHAIAQVTEQIGVSDEVLRELYEHEQELSTAQFAHGPLTAQQDAALRAIDDLIATLNPCGWKWASCDDAEFIHVPAAVLSSHLLLDLACDQLDCEASAIGTDCGVLEFPSATAFDSLHRLYRELHVHNAVLSHVQYLA